MQPPVELDTSVHIAEVVPPEKSVGEVKSEATEVTQVEIAKEEKTELPTVEKQVEEKKKEPHEETPLLLPIAKKPTPKMTVRICTCSIL